jgi:hypothetical protein
MLIPAVGKPLPCCKSWLELWMGDDRRVRDRVAAAARELVCDNGNVFAMAILCGVASSRTFAIMSSALHPPPAQGECVVVVD